MGDNTIVQVGRFTSDGSAQTVSVRSDIDWMEVYNATVADDDTQTTAVGVQYYWQRGMADDTGIEYKKSNAANAAQLTTLLASGGFTLIDSSDLTPEAAVTGTTITKAGPPVCTATSHGYVTGDIVRIYSSDEMDQINGLEFSVTRTGANTFTLTNMNTNTANFTASTEFMARKIPFNPQFYPRNRVITRISQATSAIVTLAVTHSFTVGQEVKFAISSDWGMTEIDGLSGTITAINAADTDGYTNTVTVDIDSSAFTAFAWPAASASPLTHAQLIPVGEAASSGYENLLDDATDNQSIIGMQLAAGADSPAGSTSDVIYWRAGKAFSVSNS